MAGERTLTVTILGDAKSVAKAFKETGDGAAQAEVKLEGFSRVFAKYAIGAKLISTATDVVTGAMRDGVGAVLDYGKSIDQTEKQLLGLTKSQEATSAALAVANAEADKGRAVYKDLAASMAGLIPIAKQSGESLQSLTETAELLAAINPLEGISGATIALANAASGDLTSLSDRFNFSLKIIQKYRTEGVSDIQAVQKAMQELGYDTQYLDTANQSTAKSIEILKGRLVEFFGEANKPIVDALGKQIAELNGEVGKPGFSVYAREYHKLMQELVASLGSWKALGTTIAEQALMGEKALFLLFKGASDAFVGLETFFAKLSGASDQEIARFEESAKKNDPLRRVLQGWLDSIKGQESQVADWYRQNIGDPLADEAAGTAPGSPISAAQMQASARALLQAYLSGFSTDQLDALNSITDVIADKFKGNDAGLNEVRALIAQAIGDIAAFGRVSDGTFGASEGMLGKYATTAGQASNVLGDLAAKLGDQYPVVAQLLAAYQAYTAATNGAAVASATLANAQHDLAEAQTAAALTANTLANEVSNARKDAASHAQAIATEIAGVQQAIAGVQRSAADEAQAAADRVAALQEDLAGLQASASAAATAFAAQVAQAQAEATATSEKRRRDSELVQAAIRGETEEYLAQIDAIDDATRALAARNEAIIGGARAARDAANEQVRQLNKQANKEDLALLEQIKAARESGNERQARALQRQLEQRRKGRQDDIEIARARAAVAGDEFDEAEAKLEKEAAKRDAENGKAEQRAKDRVAEIQAQAAEQKRADDAAIAAKQAEIKGVQDRAKEEARAAQDRQRQLQDEIARIEERGRKEAQQDEVRIKAALLAETIGNRIAGSKVKAESDLVGTLTLQAEQAERQATAAERTLAAEQERFKLYQQFGLAPGGTVPTPAGGGATGGGTDTRTGEAATGGSATYDAWLRNYGPRNWGPAIPGVAQPAPGFHEEVRNTGRWWVRDGYRLNAAGTGVEPNSGPPAPPPATPSPAPAPSAAPAQGGGASGQGGTAFSRAAESLTPLAAGGAPAFNVTIHIPNLGSIRSERDLQAIGDASAAGLRREWAALVRGGNGEA